MTDPSPRNSSAVDRPPSQSLSWPLVVLSLSAACAVIWGPQAAQAVAVVLLCVCLAWGISRRPEAPMLEAMTPGGVPDAPAERLVLVLERIAAALERAPALPSMTQVEPEPAPAEGRAGLRGAIRERRWADAQSLADLLPPGDPMLEEYADARAKATAELTSRMEAAQEANDPERVLELREELALVTDDGPRLAQDKVLAGWMIRAIQKRMRGGLIRPDVVLLATTAAERFSGTVEGAGLRASLPTLRRSAGLCPRCAEPYAGLADACPKCMAAALAPPPLAGAPGANGATGAIGADDIDDLVAGPRSDDLGLFLEDAG
ncbi:hypothetical protein EP7_000618 [Isosphaeraceae bacterium EP7]